MAGFAFFVCVVCDVGVVCGCGWVGVFAVCEGGVCVVVWLLCVCAVINCWCLLICCVQRQHIIRLEEDEEE